MIPKSITDYLNANRNKHLESLKELLRFPSVANVTQEPDPCTQCAQWLAQYMSDAGLDARVMPCDGKPNVFASRHISDELPTVLFYGHYDVQPPDPLDKWLSDPFEPEIRDGYIYGRGTCDDKAQLFAHLMAIEACLATDSLLVNVKVFLEGEEEIGSPSMEAFLSANTQLLSANALLVSDSSFFAPGVPAITYALRGLAYVEITVTGPDHDLHSGEYGGAVLNPVNALAKIVAGMHDSSGRVTIPGFYDDVTDLAEEERKAWSQLPFDESQLAESLGVSELAGGEKSFNTLERLWARPTLDCNGICGGHTGTGAKTIIPSSASAKISMRLVANQDPVKIVQQVRQYVATNTPGGVTSTVEEFGHGRPIMMDRTQSAISLARESLEEVFGAQAALVRCGASIPITELFQRLLGLDAVLMGFGLPGDSIHSPNERFKLDHLYMGSLASASFLNGAVTQL